MTTRSLYTIIIDSVLVARIPCETSGRGGREPFACATTCAQVTAPALPPLKLAVFGGVVLSPTEDLITVMSLYMICMHLAAS